MKTICFLVLSLFAAAPLFADAPAVTTNAATHVTSNGAIVSSTFDLKGENGSVSFEYGLVSGSLSQMTAQRNVNSHATGFTARLGPLLPSTQYFFRAKASNTDGTSFGDELSFTTLSSSGSSGGTIVETGEVVAVVGQPVPGEAAGVNYASLQLAAGPFLGKITAGHAKVAAIFSPDGSAIFKAGAEAPGLAGSVVTSLGNPSGDAAVAKLKPKAGAVTTQDDAILLAGLTDGPVRLAAQTGKDLANAAGITIKKFGAIDGNGSVIFFLATLQGAGVTSKTNLGLCAALADGSVRLLARKGQTIGSSTVKVIGTLAGVPGTLADGRWRAATDEIGARIAAADGTQHFVIISSTSAAASDWTPLLASGATLPPDAGAPIKAFSLPGFGEQDAAVAVTLLTGTDDIFKANDHAIVSASSGGLTLVAQTGSTVPDGNGAPISGVEFSSFGMPVSGAAGLTAFTASVTGSIGTAKKGIWSGMDEGTLRLVARGNSAAPGGGFFASFTSLVLPEGLNSGPIFTAKLTNKHLGVWAATADGSLSRVFATGDQIPGVAGQTRTIKSFTALLPAAGSVGAAHGYDDSQVAALVKFTDKTVALIEFSTQAK